MVRDYFMHISDQYKGLILDPFQKQAFLQLQKEASVIISAPTGSGKTLVVDFAIDLTLAAGKRLIYTSPIKALSNQKFRDFSEDYGRDNVGILTGDVTINRHAPIIIMTTEILRNMLYVDPNDSDLQNLMFVVFDEIHYINDPQRGVVWEESLILLPPTIPILLLSATIPNAHEIKSWLEEIKGKPFNLIMHHHRPVPLQSYYFDGNLHEFKGKIKIDARRHKKIRRKISNQRKLKKKKSKLVFGNNVFTPLEVVEQLNVSYFPAIYFIFSRKATEKAAQFITKSNVKLVTYQEIKEIKKHIREYKDDLDAIEDLEQIDITLNIVKKGIAFHHAGLIPLLKNIIETLFAKGLVKILFATETFAMGLNLPARTVIFHGIQKFDGETFRLMTSGEFHQMAGRAGRRGMDDFGNAIIILDFEIAEEEIVGLIEGDPEPLESQFRLSYNAICNLLQTHEPEEIITLLKSSLKEYTAEKVRSKRNLASQKQLLKLENKMAAGIKCSQKLGL
ncbi:MAG: DEAD/DEAH box helicase, partial [Candidatus Hodarchaeales archaeon]